MKTLAIELNGQDYEIQYSVDRIDGYDWGEPFIDIEIHSVYDAEDNPIKDLDSGLANDIYEILLEREINDD